MNCLKCGSDKEATFHSEAFTCNCGEEMAFKYNICPDCGIMWRSVNDVVIEESVVHYDELMTGPEMLMGGGQTKRIVITEEELEVLKNMETELSKVDKIDRGEATSMSDYIHKCLKCGAVAHETIKGRYQCSECEFEWEMIKFDDDEPL